jgi:excisionase family DNA binding protein
MNNNELLTIKEVAERLKVSQRTVMRYIKAGKILAVKMGQWRVKQSDLDDFLSNKEKGGGALSKKDFKFFNIPVLPMLKSLVFDYKRGLFKKALTLFLILSLFAMTSPNLSVLAATYLVFPSYCLGGWQNPQLASGKLDLDRDADPSSFNESNSAIADNILGEIFCGYFNSDFKENQPSEVKIEFNWYVDFGSKNNLESNSASSSNESSFLDNFIGKVLAQQVSQESAQQETSLQNQPQNLSPNPNTSDSNLNSQQEVNFSSNSNEQKESSLQEASNSISTTTDNNLSLDNLGDATSQSLANPPLPVSEMSQSLENQIIPENKNFPQDAFAQVSYSFDGRTWVLLEKINQNNWKNFSAAIPVSSWDELNRLQIAIKTIPSLDTAPKIYLDGMDARVKYKQTVKEVVYDTLSEISQPVGDLLEKISDFASNTVDAIVDIFDGNSDQNTQQNVNNQVVQDTNQIAQEVVLEPKKEKIKQKKLLFDINSQKEISAEKNLPWYSREDLNKLGLDKGNFKTRNDISLNNQSLEIRGSCDSRYFVILLFRNPQDYKEHPNLAVYNSAYPCEGGKIYFNLNQISADIVPEGDYYLLVAQQNENTPWIPVSDIIPIHIGLVIEEIEK